MREKFGKYGISAFNEHEILEILLYHMIPRKNTNDIAHALLAKFGSIAGVIRADAHALREVSGIGDSVVLAFKFIGELYCKISGEVYGDRPVRTDEGIGIYAAMRMGLSPDGSAGAVYLDEDGVRVGEEVLYRGRGRVTEDVTRRVIEGALGCGASVIVLIHNHGEDETDPSADDVVMTEELRRCAEEKGLSVRHVILGKDGYRIM